MKLERTTAPLFLVGLSLQVGASVVLADIVPGDCLTVYC